MFIRPFLKYFRPYMGRICLAVFCTIIVGLLSAVPVLMVKEFATIFLEEDPSAIEGKTEVLELAGIGLDGMSGDRQDDPQGREPATKTNLDQAKQDLATAKNRILESAPLAGIYRQWTRFTEWYLHQRRTSPFTALAALSLILLIMTALKGFAVFISKYQLAYTFYLVNLEIREAVYHHILKQDYLYFNRNTPGYLQSRVSADSNAIQSVINILLTSGIQHPITIIIMVTILFMTNARMTFHVMLIAPVIGGFLYHFARVIRKNTRKQKKQMDKLSSTLTEALTNIRLVKAFGTETHEIKKYRDQRIKLFKYVMARRVAKFGSAPVMEFITMTAVCMVILIGGYTILTQREMQTPQFLLYLFALQKLHRPIKSLSNMNNKYQLARVSGERLTEMLSLQQKLQDKPDARPFRVLQDSIRYENVELNYGDVNILKGLNFEIDKGMTVAFAGPSGGGKTTLVNLLARLFDPTSGRIMIDGTDLRDLNSRDWRSRLAMVTQDTVLFDDTVTYNITYGTEGEPDLDRVIEAAHAANAYDFILALNEGRGFATRLGTAGTSLSGGQRQRLAIARAIYMNPQVLILDEATSALDSKSQSLVHSALDNFMKERTTLIIAHRISTLRHADRIYILDDGTIDEFGTHDELVASGGYYASMVTKIISIPKDQEDDEKYTFTGDYQGLT
jgi:subfamily B ATP-binding cassette protein MsbA